MDKACGKEEVVTNLSDVFDLQTEILKLHLGSESLIPGKMKKNWTWKL